MLPATKTLEEYPFPIPPPNLLDASLPIINFSFCLKFQAMGRVGEVICRTWQTADKMKKLRGKLAEEQVKRSLESVLYRQARITNYLC